MLWDQRAETMASQAVAVTEADSIDGEFKFDLIHRAQK